jgi:hypothetical protein
MFATGELASRVWRAIASLLIVPRLQRHTSVALGICYSGDLELGIETPLTILRICRVTIGILASNGEPSESRIAGAAGRRIPNCRFAKGNR